MPSPFVVPGVTLEAVLEVAKTPRGRELYVLAAVANRDLADYVRDRVTDGDLDPALLELTPPAPEQGNADTTTAPPAPSSQAPAAAADELPAWALRPGRGVSPELAAAKTEERQRVLAAFHKRGDWIPPRYVQADLKLTRAQIEPHLAALLKAGRLEDNGRKRQALAYRYVRPVIRVDLDDEPARTFDDERHHDGPDDVDTLGPTTSAGELEDQARAATLAPPASGPTQPNPTGETQPGAGADRKFVARCTVCTAEAVSVNGAPAVLKHRDDCPELHPPRRPVVKPPRETPELSPRVRRELEREENIKRENAAAATLIDGGTLEGRVTTELSRHPRTGPELVASLVPALVRDLRADAALNVYRDADLNREAYKRIVLTIRKLERDDELERRGPGRGGKPILSIRQRAVA